MILRQEIPSEIEFFFFLYTCIQSKNLRYKLLYTLLKLLYNTTTTIPRGAKYNDNPEALKKEKLKRKTFKRKPDIIIKKDMDNKNKKKGGGKGVAKKECYGGCVVCSRVWKELNLDDRFP